MLVSVIFLFFLTEIICQYISILIKLCGSGHQLDVNMLVSSLLSPAIEREGERERKRQRDRVGGDYFRGALGGNDGPLQHN